MLSRSILSGQGAENVHNSWAVSLVNIYATEGSCRNKEPKYIIEKHWSISVYSEMNGRLQIFTHSCRAHCWWIACWWDSVPQKYDIYCRKWKEKMTIQYKWNWCIFVNVNWMSTNLLKIRCSVVTYLGVLSISLNWGFSYSTRFLSDGVLLKVLGGAKLIQTPPDRRAARTFQV